MIDAEGILRELRALRLTAAADQVEGDLQLMARLAWAYYVALVDAGFDDASAWALTRAWHAAFWRRWYGGAA